MCDTNYNNLKCNTCDKNFSHSKSLKAHITKFHSGTLLAKPSKKFKCAAVCNACNKTFVKYSNLMRHVKQYHADRVSELTKPKKYNYECSHCKKHFTHCKNFKSHLKCHQEENSIMNGLKCILCQSNLESQFPKKSDLYEHLQRRHDINIVTEVIHFNNKDEFDNWKKQEESKTNELFINAHGSYKGTTCIKTHYVCHRSGSYKTKGKGVRHLKTQGSKKINGHCIAEICLKIFEDEKCEIKYVSTHIGHKNDLGHLNLGKEERQALAAKIALKIPFDAILDEIRESIYNGNLERSHLLTKRDLLNIEKSFNIRSEFRHANDAISVDAWVEDMKANGCVLFYKPQGEPSEYLELKTEDFVLIIMNRGQAEMLKKYGSDCICVDETHGLNAYHFNLTTVLVLDDMREGFPCCFLISNRSDENVMNIFFTQIKNNIGEAVQCKVFMSDMAQAFYNAWIHVMGIPVHRLFCAWHIDRAWRNNLHKVHSKEKQVAVYKQLRTLLQERDNNAFTIMINTFVMQLSNDPDTEEFGKYFTEQYIKNVESWGYCHRINTGINTNMHIENMHHIIKYIYLNGKINKRLDRAIYILMKFVRDKLFSRLITLNKGKVSKKLRDLRARHTASNNLDIHSVMVDENGWIVTSSSSQEFYIIEEKLKNCLCKLLCSECGVCIHQFSCSCLDASIKWNMCKHIHLICKFLKAHGNIDLEELDNTPTLIIDKNMDNQDEESYNLTDALSRKNANMSEDRLCKEKEKLKVQIDDISCLEELEAAKKIIAPLQSTIFALRNSQKN